MHLDAIQSALRDATLDGWLFFDHHERDPLAYRVLGFRPPRPPSRRWYYFIPASGEPRGLVHRIESAMLNALPGAKTPISNWKAQVDARVRRKVASEHRCGRSSRPRDRRDSTRVCAGVIAP